jgi:head-tail adaptor
MAKGHRQRAGNRRIPVTIQAHNGTLNNRGQLDQAESNWTSLGTAWVSIEELSGGEVERARMHVADATHTAEMPWRSDIALTPAMRLKRRDTHKVLHIGRVDNAGQRNAKWSLVLVETQVGSADT